MSTFRPFAGSRPEDAFRQEALERALPQILRTQAVCLEEFHRTAKEFALEYLMEAQRVQLAWSGDGAEGAEPDAVFDARRAVSYLRTSTELALKFLTRMERHLATFEDAAVTSPDSESAGGLERQPGRPKAPRRYAHIKP